jgi:hypothetical protein
MGQPRISRFQHTGNRYYSFEFFQEAPRLLTIATINAKDLFYFAQQILTGKWFL